MSLTVLIVDDHEAARDGLASLLKKAGGVQVEAAVGSGTEAIDYLKSNSVDIVLLDVRMTGMDGIATLAEIRRDNPVPVMMFSSYDNPTYVARAAALGATDFLLKSASIERIVGAMKNVVDGGVLQQDSRLRRIRHMMRQDVDTTKLPEELPLTCREAQVLRHIALGLSNKEIAKSLEISVETVKEHVQNILRKAKASDRTDAAVRAVKLGLVD